MSKEVSIEAKKIMALQDLLNSEGWKILKEDLENDLKITEAKLFGEIPLGQGESHEFLQRERVDRLELINMPTNLIEELSEEPSEEPDLEVY